MRKLLRFAMLALAATPLALPLPAASGKLSVYPENVVLFGEGVRQHIVVSWTDADGMARDVTTQASVELSGPAARLEQPGMLRALAGGSARLTASYNGTAASATVEVRAAGGTRELSFVKDIVPIFTKFGCAGSNCHGSIRGKAAFKLSLFGYEPSLDYEAIVKASDGHRVNLKDPEASLILKKPTFQVPHGGGVRFEKNSLPYDAIVEWLRTGAKYDSVGSPRLASLSVYPAERWMVGVGQTQQLVVTGRYTDGTVEDMTDKVQFTSNDEAVIDITRAGVLKTVAPGESTIMVRTLGQAIAARVFVVQSAAGPDYPAVQANNFVDRFVFEKLRRMNVLPSALSSDEHFLRRVYLDVLGTLPTADEAVEFLDSRDPAKRAKLIDALLERPERGDFWATYFADLFRLGFNESRDKGAKIFYDWIRQSVIEDKPYDRMVSELLVSQGNLYYEPTANFYFVSRKLDPGDVATHVSQAFLGVRVECARCHNHPWEKYTQDDFYGLAAFFSRLDTKFVHAGSESDVYLKDSGEVIHPKTKQAVQPKYLDGPTDSEKPGQDIRQALARWVTSPQNPFFARTIANRIWRRYFDRGIVEPVDDFRVTNPPSNTELLNALAADFVAHGYSIKHMERTILNSRAYQLSSLPNDSNRHDTVNYSRYYLKRMSAEELMDAIVDVTGVEERFTGWAPGTRAMQIPHGAPSFLLTAFGRVADREFAQDRKEDPSITQVLHLMNGATLNEKIVSPEGRLAKWLAASGHPMDNSALTDRLFLTTLARHARPEEQTAIQERIAAGPPDGRAQVFQDVMWALINSKEFIYNH
jgi:hypothetical protein